MAAALDAGLAFESVLVAPGFAASESGARLLRRLPRPPLEVDEELLAGLADADAPRGVLAVGRIARGGVDGLPVESRGLYLFLDGVQEPGNVGALARVAEAFGAAALALGPGCAHPNHPRALRASAGSLLRLPVARDAAPADLDRRLAPAAARWAGLDAHGGDPLPARRPEGAWILALGAEGRGLSPEVAARLDRRFTIGLAPPVESLNVAVAAGIALHALCPR